jgi:cytochrome c5
MRLVLWSVVLAVVACDERGQRAAPVADAAPSVPASAPAIAPAAQPLGPDEIWTKRCVVCHGKQGKGDGPGAAALNPKPQSLRDPAWQKSVTDEEIEKAIVRGGVAVGKSTAMPANPDLANKPDVVKGLVKKVRSFAP